MFERLNINKLLKHSDLLIAFGVMGTLLVMILPVPAFVMDILLVLSITLSIAILFVGVYTGKPLDFSVFPTVLLFATLFRLSLNVASTRLILVHGHEGGSAAGHIIETFGNFVVGGSYFVGTVVFILLIIINFVVITKGSGRVAEVAARFILDAMPGKQMSIDADLNAGLINEEQARERRKKIEQEADFYGAMDGASKFVRGDAIAGILITLINIIGGLGIGIFQKGLDLSRAAELYTLMTIGDGLVNQIPSLIVSTAAGIVVTRAASGNDLSKEVAKQIFLQPRAMSVTAGVLALLGIMPGIPTFPFLFIAAVVGGLSMAVKRFQAKEAEEKQITERKQAEAQSHDTHTPPEVDILELEVGYGLVNLVEGDQKGDLIDRIFGIRKEFARDLGIVVPKVRVKDNLELKPTQYSILIKGVQVGGGELMSGYVLAMDSGSVEVKMAGIEVKEPVFGINALWIPEKNRERAQMAGYTVVDLGAIIATHLSELIRKHAAELLGRQEMQSLVENIQATRPKVVEELIPTLLPLGSVLKVCQNLLREGVPIRDLLTILETLANHATASKDPEVLTEYVRAALARSITSRLTRGTNDLEVINFVPGVEDVLIRSYQRGESGGAFNFEAGFLQKLINGIQGTLDKVVFTNGLPVLLCHPMIRPSLRKITERYLPDLFILTVNEISSNAKVKSIAAVEA